MSSIMRWRNGLMVCVDCVIALLLSQNEADCLIPQHRKQNLWLSEPAASAQTTNYRASGLVPWPGRDEESAHRGGFLFVAVQWSANDTKPTSPTVAVSAEINTKLTLRVACYYFGFQLLPFPARVGRGSPRPMRSSRVAVTQRAARRSDGLLIPNDGNMLPPRPPFCSWHSVD